MATKILVVDDDEEYRDLLSNILKRRGYTVRTAENVDAAIEELERDSYAVVTVDMQFKTGATEAIAGEDLLIHLRENYDKTRCIVVSGSPEVSKEEIADFGRKYGARFVEKQRLNATKFAALVKEVLQEMGAALSEGGGSMKAESLRKQLTSHRRNVWRLEEKLAKHTELEAPITLLNQIEDEKKEIARLEAELDKL